MLKSEILDRIILYYGLKNKTGLASFLGVSAQTISNWYSRNSIDFDQVFEKCAGLDLNWLIYGHVSEYQGLSSKPSIAADNRALYDVPVLRNKIIPVISPFGYAISEITGEVITSGTDTVAVPEYLVNDGECIAFRFGNNSMSPIYSAGDCVVCKRIVEGVGSVIYSHNPYLFALDGGELLVRRMEISKKNMQRIFFSADNVDKHEFPNMEIDIRDIKAVWSIKLKLANDLSTFEVMSKRLTDLERDIAELKQALHKNA